MFKIILVFWRWFVFYLHNHFNYMIGDTSKNTSPERRNQNEMDDENESLLTRINNEQITLVWLDRYAINNKSSFSEDIHLTKTILRELNDYVVLFDHESECLNYISSVKNETILLIVSGSYATPNLLNTLHVSRHVDSIFIFCQDKNNYERLQTNIYYKIIGIFDEQISLCSSIKHAITLADKQSNIFALYNSDKQKSMRDLSRESGSFIFLQLVKQVIKRMSANNASTDDSKQEMITKCRLYYRGNQKEMKNIDDFEENYKPNEAIKWYTRDSFLYKLINKALRTEDIDALYTYRYYIVDLCTCLAENTKILRKETSNLTVYRGMKMSKSERERIKESVGSHIAVSAFFSTSREVSVAKIYAGIEKHKPSLSIPDVLESILLVIDVNLDLNPDLVLADVKHLSIFSDEAEVIFDLGTVFKIESFTYIEEDNYWICYMQTSSKGQDITKEYLKFKQTELNMSTDIEIVFGDLLYDMGEWLKSRIYFEKMSTQRIDDPQVHMGIARCYEALNQSDQALLHLKQAYKMVLKSDRQCFALAAKICFYSSRVHYICNNFEESLVFNKKALELYKKAGEVQNRAGIAETLRCAGLIYFLKCDHDASLEHFQQALLLFEDIYRFDHPDKSTALISLSYAYYLRGEYQRALKYMLDGIAIQERLLPNDHPHLAAHINSVGKLLYKQGKYSEALERFYFAMDLYDRRMTENNRTYTIILNNIGKALYRLNNLDEAFTYYSRALHYLQTLFLTKSPDHADLAYTWKNIGEIHLIKCDATGALELFERARDMYRRLFTSDDYHRDIGKCWYLIAQAHVTLENNAQALEAFEITFKIWTCKLPKYHPDLAFYHQTVADFYMNTTKQINEAIEHFQIAQSIYDKIPDTDSHQEEKGTIRTKLILLTNQQKSSL